VVTKPQQRQAYQRVFAILNKTRDRILAEAKLAMKATVRGDSTAVTDFIQVLNEGRSVKGMTPRPRRPAARDDRLRLAPAERRAGIAGTEIERISPGRDTLKARTFLVLTWSRVDLLSEDLAHEHRSWSSSRRRGTAP